MMKTGVAQINRVSLLGGTPLDFLKNGCEIGIGDIRQNDAQRHGSLRYQSPGERVRRKVIFSDHRFDAGLFISGDRHFAI